MDKFKLGKNIKYQIEDIIVQQSWYIIQDMGYIWQVDSEIKGLIFDPIKSQICMLVYRKICYDLNNLGEYNEEV